MARIERIFDTPETAQRLTPSAKTFLQSLLAAGRSES
jgi:hypothetical protein